MRGDRTNLLEAANNSKFKWCPLRRHRVWTSMRRFATVLSTEASRTLARLANYDVCFIRHGNTGKAKI